MSCGSDYMQFAAIMNASLGYDHFQAGTSWWTHDTQFCNFFYGGRQTWQHWYTNWSLTGQAVQADILADAIAGCK